MLGSMRFMCCPLLVLSDDKNLVITERYVYSRSVGIKALGGRKQRRDAWSICHGLCKVLGALACRSRRAAGAPGWLGVRFGERDKNRVDQEGSQHAAEGHNYVMMAGE